MSKDAIALVLDVGKCMSVLNKLEDAKRFLKLVVRSKLLFSKRDELCLIVAGSNRTDNPLADSDPSSYQNIALVKGVAPTDIDLLESLEDLAGEDAESDPVDALLVALQVLHDRVGKYKFTKRIFFVTTAAGEIQDEEQMSEIASKFLEMGVKVNLIGVDLFKEGVELDGIRCRNKELLTKFLSGFDGVSWSLEEALAEGRSMLVKSVRSVPKFKGVLEISSHLHLRVQTFAKTMEQKFPTLERISVPARESDADEISVKLSRAYINKFQETGEDLDEDERVRAYRYGKSYIPFSKIDENLLKFQSAAGIKVLGFIPSSEIHRHQFLNAVDVLCAQNGFEKSRIGLSALIRSMLQKDYVAIARYVKRQNSEPFLACLYPFVSEDTECMYVCQLPFDEDVREFPFPAFARNPKYEVTPAQKKSARELIEKFSLDSFDSLSPETTPNPGLQRYYSCVESRALDPEADLSIVDPSVQELLESFKGIPEDDPVFKKFCDFFPLHAQVKQKKDEKKHWRQALESISAEPTLQESIEPSTEKVEFKADDLLRRRAASIGLVDPVRDFSDLVADPTSREHAFSESWNVIQDLVRNSYMGNQFAKACDLLFALRSFALASHSSDLVTRFNATLNTTRSSLDVSGFWDMVSAKSDSVAMISDAEAPGGATQAEMNQFKNMTATAVQEDQGHKPSEEKEEDFWEDIE